MVTSKRERARAPQATPTEKTVRFANSSVLQTLVGEQDGNIKTIERELEVQIGRGPDGLIVSGQDSEVAIAHDLLTQLQELIEKGETIFPGDIDRAIRMLSEDRHIRLEELFRDHIKIAGRNHSIVPKTFTQKAYLEAIRAHELVFGIGPAGTGKTYLAMAMAVSALMRKEVKRVVLCRPAVEAGEKLGFLPGDMAEKVNPYLRPLYDALHDMVEFERAKEMVEKGMVEVAPLAFMRGRTLTNSFVILDEAQNTTTGQMKMFLTRLGRGSRCIVTGDVTQIDLPRGITSGLTHAIKVLGDVHQIGFTYFTGADVVRHPLVARIVEAYRRVEESEEA